MPIIPFVIALKEEIRILQPKYVLLELGDSIYGLDTNDFKDKIYVNFNIKFENETNKECFVLGCSKGNSGETYILTKRPERRVHQTKAQQVEQIMQKIEMYK